MEPPFTLPFDTFWNWMMGHPNCILRAGTPETVVYDEDDFHWHFVNYEGGAVGVQVMRGKRSIVELIVDPELVAYVQGVNGEIETEHVFELISETETERTAAYFFVLAHGYEDELMVPPGRVH